MTEAEVKRKPKPPYDPCPFCHGRVEEDRNEQGELIAVFCTRCPNYYSKCE
ncbi:MAG: hypothetical protein ACLP56_24475 [Candidatus Sulfotelmatobacter sp.]